MTPQQRAEALRARLIHIAQACAAADVPLPMRRDLARITGATQRQIDRHISWLKDTGAITTLRRWHRVYVRVAS